MHETAVNTFSGRLNNRILLNQHATCKKFHYTNSCYNCTQCYPIHLQQNHNKKSHQNNNNNKIENKNKTHTLTYRQTKTILSIHGI